MNRTELFDKTLKLIYDNPDTFWSIGTWAEKELHLNDDPLIESVVNEILEKKLATRGQNSKWSLMLDYEGRLFMEKYGSYSAFLLQEQKNQNKDNKKNWWSKTIDHSNKILGTIIGLLSLLIAWLSYSSNQEINHLKQTLLKHDSTTWETRKVIASQERAIDSLATFVTITKLTPDKVIGKFVYTTVFGETAITINKAGDFSVTSYLEFSWPMCQGNWKISGDTLLLNHTKVTHYPSKNVSDTARTEKYIMINNELFELYKDGNKYYIDPKEKSAYIKTE